jgi:hypothetical protein
MPSRSGSLTSCPPVNSVIDTQYLPTSESPLYKPLSTVLQVPVLSSVLPGQLLMC